MDRAPAQYTGSNPSLLPLAYDKVPQLRIAERPRAVESWHCQIQTFPDSAGERREGGRGRGRGREGERGRQREEERVHVVERGGGGGGGGGGR